jgi:hypothetical protein
MGFLFMTIDKNEFYDDYYIDRLSITEICKKYEMNQYDLLGWMNSIKWPTRESCPNFKIPEINNRYVEITKQDYETSNPKPTKFTNILLPDKNTEINVIDTNKRTLQPYAIDKKSKKGKTTPTLNGRKIKFQKRLCKFLKFTPDMEIEQNKKYIKIISDLFVVNLYETNSYLDYCIAGKVGEKVKKFYYGIWKKDFDENIKTSEK